MGNTGARHVVLIPSFNAGVKLAETVAAARRHGWPVWVVVDGSTDDSFKALVPDGVKLRVIERARNGGKGAAVLDGLRDAAKAGFTHALVMDSDGQHPAGLIPEFIRMSCKNPKSMILGVPVFARDAPLLRVVWRRVSNALVHIETGGGIADSLFGFRVYPIVPLLGVMETTHRMRRFDFDAEAAVRLCWLGVRAINLPAPVRYPPKAEGGVSQFRYMRDNILLAGMHMRLLGEMLWRGWVREGWVPRRERRGWPRAAPPQSLP